LQSSAENPKIRKNKNEKHFLKSCTLKINIMHEMGIVMQVVEIATASIPDSMKNARVERVNLKVGRLSAAVPASLRFCFEIITKDTPLEGAELRIKEIPVVAKCRECDTEWTITGPAFNCEKCRSGSIEIISGRELDIESVEIADESETTE